MVEAGGEPGGGEPWVPDVSADGEAETAAGVEAAGMRDGEGDDGGGGAKEGSAASCSSSGVGVGLASLESDVGLGGVPPADGVGGEPPTTLAGSGAADSPSSSEGRPGRGDGSCW